MINKIIVCDSRETRNAVAALLYEHGHSVLYVCPDYFGLQITSILDNKALSAQVHLMIAIKFAAKVSIVPEIGNG